jgi:hypothetical protein
MRSSLTCLVSSGFSGNLRIGNKFINVSFSEFPFQMYILERRPRVKVLISYQFGKNFMNSSCPLHRFSKSFAHNGISHGLICIETFF